MDFRFTFTSTNGILRRIELKYKGSEKEIKNGPPEIQNKQKNNYTTNIFAEKKRNQCNCLSCLRDLLSLMSFISGSVERERGSNKEGLRGRKKSYKNEFFREKKTHTHKNMKK